MPDDDPTDRPDGHRRRSEAAALRADELRLLRDRLVAGEKLTAADLDQAIRHLEDAVRRAEQAHQRAAVAHQRTADVHRRAAALAAAVGDDAAADRHRQAAVDAELAAQHELDDAAADPTGEGTPT
jgi:hypothetical protein